MQIFNIRLLSQLKPFGLTSTITPKPIENKTCNFAGSNKNDNYYLKVKTLSIMRSEEVFLWRKPLLNQKPELAFTKQVL